MPDPLRAAILLAAGSGTVKKVVQNAPVSKGVVRRFVAGEDLAAAVTAVRGLASHGLAASLDHLGEDTTSREQATAVVTAYESLLQAISDDGLGASVEVSVKLTAVGLGLDEAFALENAHRIVAAATAAGTTVTVDMEDHTRTDATLSAVQALRKEQPSVGAVIQAYLFRSEGDCRELAGSGSRVRLCKGAYKEPASVAHQARADVTAAYGRCLRILMDGSGYPMIATHDPELVTLGESLAAGRDSYEFQMLYGVRPAEQQRLVDAGHTVRIYVPYGSEWYGYLMRRLAEKPANLQFFLRALVDRS